MQEDRGGAEVPEWVNPDDPVWASDVVIPPGKQHYSFGAIRL